MENDAMKRISPESTLENAIADIKESGFDGLKPYLTPEALQKAQNFLALSSRRRHTYVWRNGHGHVLYDAAE